MNKVYQVFVSSTYSDLAKERRAVSDTLAKAGYIAAGMELFPATDQRQLDFIKRIIDRSDFYVVIVGGRYGSLADDHLSFTEREYEYAASAGIPVLAFLHAKPEEIAVGKTDQNREKAKKLQAFREKLAKSRIVDFWIDAPDLSTKVVISVVQATNLFPRVGWVRGDQAIDPKVLQESERLRLEVSDLRKQLGELTSEDVRFPPHLMGPDDSLEFTIEKTYSNKEDQSKVDRQERVNATAALGQIFIDIFDSILAEPLEHSLQRIIGRALCKPTADEGAVQIEISPSQVTTLRFHFEALGLIRAIGAVSKGPLLGTMIGNRKYIAWSITEKGRRFVAQSRAIHRIFLDEGRQEKSE